MCFRFNIIKCISMLIISLLDCIWMNNDQQLISSRICVYSSFDFVEKCNLIKTDSICSMCDRIGIDTPLSVHSFFFIFQFIQCDRNCSLCVQKSEYSSVKTLYMRNFNRSLDTPNCAMQFANFYSYQIYLANTEFSRSSIH